MWIGLYLRLSFYLIPFVKVWSILLLSLDVLLGTIGEFFLLSYFSRKRSNDLAEISAILGLS